MDQFVYRLYTENTNIDRLHSLIGISFDGYTVYAAQGVWRGDKELTVVFEIISGDLSTLSTLKGIADVICEENHQQAVLVTRSPVESFLFTGERARNPRLGLNGTLSNKGGNQ